MKLLKTFIAAATIAIATITPTYAMELEAKGDPAILTVLKTEALACNRFLMMKVNREAKAISSDFKVIKAVIDGRKDVIDDQNVTMVFSRYTFTLDGAEYRATCVATFKGVEYASYHLPTGRFSWSPGNGWQKVEE